MTRRVVVFPRAKPALLLSTFMAICAVSLCQTNPHYVPQPPSAELQKFEPFLGKYEVSGDYANLPWTGTLELKKVIRGWYIEQIIQIKSPGIDREFWVLATWDKNTQKYRLWGFQTLPSQVEGDVRFEYKEMITEFAYPTPDGQKATSTNRYTFVGNNELLVTSYRHVGNEPVRGQDAVVGKPQHLFQATTPGIGIPFDVSLDGRRLLVNHADEDTQAPLHLVTNWTADLKK